ncbi:Histone deacetylase hda1 [Geranomyces variabilis]|uniref:Histone deacetylase hda1 n=1 Tax=Geranomyces variabilis TaxID=109894 RepID=A0AAD5THM5_9FUNG|nr:Histone deacetylase hda1 [Geranomyces variabilis]
MTHQLMSLAGGKIVVCLEGGYHLNAVANSVAAVTGTLLGDAPTPLDTRLRISADCANVVHKVREIQSQFWNASNSENNGALNRYDTTGTSFIDRRPSDNDLFSAPEILAGYRRYHLAQNLALEYHAITDPAIVDFPAQIHAR